MGSRSKLLALLIILLFAFWLRVHQLELWSFWIDEGFTASRAWYTVERMLANTTWLQEYVYVDPHPPFYFLVVRFFTTVGGQSDFVYRYFSVLAALLTVPVVYRIGRNLSTPLTGIIAAILLTTNTLHITYSREARMYSLAALLVSLTVCLFLRERRRQRNSRLMLAIAVCALLGLLTNYLVISIVLPLLLLVAAMLWQRGNRVIVYLIGGFIVLSAIFLLIRPPDLDHFLGINSYSFNWSALFGTLERGISDLFLPGTAAIGQWPLLLLTVVVYGLFGLGLWRFGVSAETYTLLAWLFAPIAGFALLTFLDTEKYKSLFHVRYIIIATPGGILLMSHALSCLMGSTRLLRIIGALCLISMLAGTVSTTNALYNNSAIANDDYRAMMQTIERLAGDNDAIVFHDTGKWLLWQHYATRDDIAYHGLPVNPRPFDLDTISTLERIAVQHDRIWFAWGGQLHGRDPDNGVKQWLDEHAAIMQEWNFHATTTAMRLTGYATDASPASQSNEAMLNETPLTISVMSELPIVRPTVWVQAAWPTSAENLPTQISFALRDSGGHETGVSVSAEISTDTQSLQRPLQLPIGLPPGNYTLWAQAADRPWQQIADLPVSGTSQWAYMPALDLTQTLNMRLGAYKLLGLTGDYDTVHPGHSVPLNAYWQFMDEAAPDASQDTATVMLLTPTGAALTERSLSLDASQLSPGDIVATEIGISLDAEAETGRYQLRWQLAEQQKTRGGLTVKSWPFVRTHPENSQLFKAAFGDEIVLQGAHKVMQSVGQDEQLSLRLYWQTEAALEQSYYAFVHVVSAETGNIIAQEDRVPARWLRPTNTWRPGELIEDTYTLTLPPGKEAFNIYVGLYQPDSGQRLPVIFNDVSQPDSRLLLPNE